MNIVLFYSIIGFLLFNVSLIYFVGFIGNLSFIPKTIDCCKTSEPLYSIINNIILILAFGLQHSIMARQSFKKWWHKFIPEAIERTTYVVFASLLLLMLSWYWLPLPFIVWEITRPVGYWVLSGLFWFGWLFATFSSGLIDLLELTGVRQGYCYAKNIPLPPPKFKVIFVYQYIRHPIMLGTLIGLWATPTMTIGHFLLSVSFSIYIFIGILYEEKDLIRTFKEEYIEYKQSTNSLIPFKILYSFLSSALRRSTP